MRNKDSKYKVRISWLRRLMGLKDNDSRKDPTRGWFVLPPKSPWAPIGAPQTPMPQPPSPGSEESQSDPLR